MGNHSNEPSERPSGANPWAMAFGAGAELVATVLVCVFAGRWADGKLGTEPWLLLLGIFAGITLGLYQLLRKSKLPGRTGRS